MANPALLLSFTLGVLAAVKSVPLERGDHPEELVTRCIIEVLSNALGKENAPPINPECKEILKKSGHREKEEKKSVGEDVQYEEGHFKGPDDGEMQQLVNDKDLHQNVEEEKKHDEENAGKLEEEDHKGEEEKRHSKAKAFSNQEVEHEEDKSQPSERRSEEADEEENKSNSGHQQTEDSNKEKKHYEEDSENALRELFQKRHHSAERSMEDLADEEEDKQRAGHRHSTERMHSSEKRNRESEEESSEYRPHQMKRHGSHLPRESEEWDENEDVEKRYYKPKHNNRKIDYSQNRDDESEESDDDNTRYRDKKSHNAANYDMEPYGHHHHHHHEKRSSYEDHSSEEVEKKRHQNIGSDEEWEKLNSNWENKEEEEKRHTSGESEEKKHYYEKRRNQNNLHWDLRPHHEEKKEHSDESQEITDKHYAKSSAEEKRHYSQYQKNRAEEPGTQHSNEKEDEKRHYFGEDRMGEEKRFYSTNFADDADTDKKHYSEEKKRRDEESEEPLDEMKNLEKFKFEPYFKQQLDKRAVRPYTAYNKNLWWSNRHFEKRRNLGSQIVDSKDTNNHKPFLPEYNDYDLWEKRQLMEDVNPEYVEKKSPSRIHKFDIKRQYNRMDELAQLLNYKKKSAEFPDLYNSEEGFKKRHMMQTKRGNLIQRPLTEEEEKELENLAAMDLELQKIAEKLNDNRRG